MDKNTHNRRSPPSDSVALLFHLTVTTKQRTGHEVGSPFTSQVLHLVLVARLEIFPKRRMDE